VRPFLYSLPQLGFVRQFMMIIGPISSICDFFTFGVPTLRENTYTEKEESEGSGDAKDETAGVQARVVGAGVTDASDEKDSVGQNGESEPSEDEAFRVERFPAPTGRIHRDESEHPGSRRDDRGGGDGVPARTHSAIQNSSARLL
jgi:hypothetical protein